MNSTLIKYVADRLTRGEKMFALKIHEKDNVATVFDHDVKAGSIVNVTDRDGGVIPITLLEDIPYGHKIALRDIPAGEFIIKYGEVIGKASCPIPKGGYVHTHNVESTRARGDLMAT